MLSQSRAGLYFDQCRDDNEINEVLSGYVVCKFLNGSNCAQVLQKIRYLCMYLRATGRSHILRIGAYSFKAISFEVAIGGGRIGSSAAGTKRGIELHNQIRRWAASKKNCRVSTDRTYGGPGTVSSYLNPTQITRLRRLMDMDDRPPWLEHYFSARCGVLDGMAFTLPDYDSRIQTLPLYAAEDIREGLESVERVLHETQMEEEEVFMNTHTS